MANWTHKDVDIFLEQLGGAMRGVVDRGRAEGIMVRQWCEEIEVEPIENWRQYERGDFHIEIVLPKRKHAICEISPANLVTTAVAMLQFGEEYE